MVCFYKPSVKIETGVGLCVVDAKVTIVDKQTIYCSIQLHVLFTV
jgi:hypothetical protein